MTTVMDELLKTESLLALVCRETAKSSVELDDEIDSLGIDSLEFINLIQAIEAEFGCSIPDEDYAQINTIRDLRERI